MTDPAFDYRAYRLLVPPRLRPPAHQRPQLAWSQPSIPAPQPADELAVRLGAIRNSLAQIRQNLRPLCVILWRRLVAWADNRYGWATAGCGWSGIVFFAAQYFTR